MMSRRHRAASLLLAAALAIAGASGAAAQGLVIRAIGPAAGAHPVGSTLAAGTMLGAGDRIDVLERGGTRQLIGPTRYLPAMKSTARENVQLVVTQLLDRRQLVKRAGAVDASRVEGVMRSLPGNRGSATRGFSFRRETATAETALPPTGRYEQTLWMIDASEPGTTCFPAGNAPVIWHPPAAVAQGALIAPAKGAPMSVRWDAAAATAPFPGTPPAAPGRYDLTTSAGTRTPVTLVPIADTGTLDDLVVTLDQAGCRAQLGYLLDQYPGPQTPEPQTP